MSRPLVKAVYGVVLLLVVTYAFFALRGQNGIQAMMQKRQELHELEKRNGVLAREIEQKRQRIHRLRESEADQDIEIRNRLKLVRPGEKVYVVPEKTPQPAAPAQ